MSHSKPMRSLLDATACCPSVLGAPLARGPRPPQLAPASPRSPIPCGSGC